MTVRNYARPGSVPLVAPGTPGSTGGTLGTVTDGVTTVSPVTEITVVGTIVDLGGGNVQITSGAAGIEVKEQDGTPDATGVTVVQVPNGGLTDNTGGNVTLEYAQRRGGVREDVQTIAASGAAQTLDLSLYNLFDITLTANCTLTYSNPPASGVGGSWGLIVRQGGAGSYTLTYPAAQAWQAANGTMTGSAPTLHTAVGAEDVIGISTLDGGTSYGGLLVGAGIPSFATPSIALGTAAAAGAASTVIRSDSTIAAFDSTVPTTQAFGDAAATGSAAFAARRDHRHGMPAAPLGSDHEHIGNVTFSGDGATTAYTLPAAPFDAYSVAAFVAGARTDVTLSGALLDTMTFAVAPAAGTNNIVVDLVAAVV